MENSTNNYGSRHGIVKYNVLDYVHVYYLQVQGIEEYDQIFSLVVGQLHLLELAINDGRSAERGRRFLDFRSHSTSS